EPLESERSEHNRTLTALTSRLLMASSERSVCHESRWRGSLMLPLTLGISSSFLSLAMSESAIGEHKTTACAVSSVIEQLEQSLDCLFHVGIAFDTFSTFSNA